MLLANHRRTTTTTTTPIGSMHDALRLVELRFVDRGTWFVDATQTLLPLAEHYAPTTSFDACDVSLLCSLALRCTDFCVDEPTRAAVDAIRRARNVVAHAVRARLPDTDLGGELRALADAVALLGGGDDGARILACADKAAATTEAACGTDDKVARDGPTAARDDPAAALRDVAQWRDAPVAKFAVSVITHAPFTIVNHGTIVVQRRRRSGRPSRRGPAAQAGGEVGSEDDDVFRAAARGDIAALQRLVARDGKAVLTKQRPADDPVVVAEPYRLGEQPIHVAALGCQLATIKWLHKTGVWLGVEATGGDTLLTYAASANSVETIQWLEQQGQKIDEPSSVPPHCRPIHAAAAKNALQAVQYLVSRGARVYHRASDGAQPIHSAARRGSFDTLRWLVASGASLHAKTNDGSSVVHYAAASGNVMLLRWLEDAGCDISARKRNGKTPVCIAVMHDNVECVEFLLSKGASLDVCDAAGKRPLDWVIERDAHRTLRWLVDNKFVTGTETIVGRGTLQTCASADRSTRVYSVMHAVGLVE